MQPSPRLALSNELDVYVNRAAYVTRERKGFIDVFQVTILINW